VFASGNYFEAGFVACALEGHGDAFVINDNICRMYPAAPLVGGAKVVIDPEDLEAATDVLMQILPREGPV